MDALCFLDRSFSRPLQKSKHVLTVKKCWRIMGICRSTVVSEREGKMRIRKLVLLVLLSALAAVLALLFTVYMLNLDMKLVRGVVLPFLNRHYDRQKREHVI